jgi:hypothetical protein
MDQEKWQKGEHSQDINSPSQREATHCKNCNHGPAVIREAN